MFFLAGLQGMGPHGVRQPCHNMTTKIDPSKFLDIPTSEAIDPAAAKAAKAAAAKAAKAAAKKAADAEKASQALARIPDKSKPAPREGSGGKGNVLPNASKAQLRAAFEKDSSALAAVLVSLGAVERVQSGKNGVQARRVYADLATLEANRSKLNAEDKKLAGAALDALRAVGALRGKFVSLELFTNSVAVRSRRDASKNHKQP